ncbi:hypothetical protein [Bosea sp. TAF32]|uniref:hypothetical protein n=1 Tax=Bosea sp. TAF32 TaxID=3237482 RepID=UPI003F8D976E
MTLVKAFAARVRAGMEDGELDERLDADAAGSMLLMLRSGLKVAARGGVSGSELRDAACLALRSRTRSR